MTVANLVAVFREVCVAHQIEDTELDVVIVAWPVKMRFPPVVDFALALGFVETGDEWDEPPGQLMLSFKARCGAMGYLAPRFNGHLQSDDGLDTSRRITAFCKSPIFRWFGDQISYDVSVRLSNSEDFFHLMSKLIPAMQDAGYACCITDVDDNSCSNSVDG
ncbi:hypothetical protein LF1_52170 [Rubripirellula obstinata]|uniref:Uncharacterized protein n=1 Tax=Rubripirellula obstinata TaxID=406547 RepID=A0A5B1C8B7_9BACT|nr:hypothetical protein LF1_52170 [Rubripirellula obstinata]